MPTDLLPLDEAARRLGVSRRRAEAMVLSGQLPAERLGRQWVVSPQAVRRTAGVRSSGGRPVRPEKAWALIAELPDALSGGPAGLDAIRRKVRPRAEHLDVYVHPGAMDVLLDGEVLGGRDAAAAAGAPVDAGVVHDVYVRRSEAAALLARAGAERTLEGANVHVHVVDDEAWPFEEDCRTAGPWVAWLDLADREDRAAITLLDRLIGGRLHA
jgi:excisionase family DNA binding protein